jgi:hypothetical protein
MRTATWLKIFSGKPIAWFETAYLFHLDSDESAPKQNAIRRVKQALQCNIGYQ